MKLAKKITGVLNIQPGEGRLVFLLLLQYVMYGGASIFIQTAAFSLFLTQFDPQTLAYTTVLNAGLVIGLTFVYLRLGNRMSFGNLLVANVSFQLLVILLFRAGLAATGERWIVFFLPTVFQIAINLGNFAFWPLAARLFDVRQSKRLLGIVGAGQWISIVLFGLVMAPIVALIGTPNLLILAAVSVAGELGLVYLITRSYAPRLAAAPTPARAQFTPQPTRREQPASVLWRNPYISLIFGLVFVWWLVFFIIDNFFYRMAGLQYGDANQLAGFLGIFMAVMGVLTLIGNSLLSGPILEHLGLGNSLLILPVVLVIGTLLSALVSGAGTAIVLLFWLAVVIKLVDSAFGFSFDKSAQTVLYHPLPASTRPQVQATADGIVMAAGMALAGAGLIAFNFLFPGNNLPLIIALVISATGWTILALLLRRRYPQMLVLALNKRTLSGANLPVADLSSVSVLQQALRNPHPGAALYALNTLDQIDPALVTSQLPTLLEHPAIEVRKTAIERIESEKLESAQALLSQHLEKEPSPEVRVFIVCALAALGDTHAQTTLLTYLEDPEPGICRTAMLGLLRSAGVDGRQAVQRKITRMANSAQPADRSLAAEWIADAGMQDCINLLSQLLNDPTPAVKRAALRAAGQMKAAALWPQVLEALSDQLLHGAALSALVSGGDEALVEIEKAFNSYTSADPHKSVYWSRLAQACGRIGGSRAISVLKSMLRVEDVVVRSQVVQSLCRAGYHASGADIAQIKTCIQTELGYAGWVLVVAEDASQANDSQLLCAALTSHFTACRDRLFSLLSFLYDAPTVLRARDNLLNGSVDKKAYALEVLDTQIEPELKTPCLAVFEDLTPAQRLSHLRISYSQSAQDRQRRLQEVHDSGAKVSEWARTCSAYALAEQTRRKDDPTLSVVQIVSLLKTMSILTGTPDEVLADIAPLVDQVTCKAGTRIVEKGDIGDSIYMIASGRVRVHDGERVLNYLDAGDEFGEIAVLDPGPRSASVTATEDTLLLRLDRTTLDELVEDRVEVSRGITLVLSRFLRSRLIDLSALHSQLSGITPG